MYEQSRQLDQAVLWPFTAGKAMPFEGDIEHPRRIEPSHPAVQAALEFFKPFVRKYADGEKTLVEMKAEKNEALNKYRKANPCLKKWEISMEDGSVVTTVEKEKKRRSRERGLANVQPQRTQTEWGRKSRRGISKRRSS